MYYIQVTFYYYENKIVYNGPLFEDGTIKTFQTKDDALQYLLKQGATRQLTANKYARPEVYYNHGDAYNPDYEIRKSRNQ